MKGKDGIDHINIFSRGETELGRMLSNFAHLPIQFYEHEQAESLEGYWYFLITGSMHPQLLKLHGWNAKEQGRKFEETVKPWDPDFRAKIIRAMKLKVEQHPKLKSSLKDSVLPFAHYYVFNGVKKEAGFEWIVEAWENIRKELKG